MDEVFPHAPSTKHRMVALPRQRGRNRRGGGGGFLLRPIGQDLVVYLHSSPKLLAVLGFLPPKQRQRNSGNSESISDKIATISGAFSAIFATISKTALEHCARRKSIPFDDNPCIANL